MISLSAFAHILLLASALCLLAGAAALCLQSRRAERTQRRALRTLAFIVAMWGCAFLPEPIRSCFGSSFAFHPMSIAALTLGNLYIIISLLYPLEVARPGWITLRHLLLLLLPYLLVTGIYFAGLLLMGQPLTEYDSLSALIVRFGSFHVWYRFVLYLSVCLYLGYLLLTVSTSEADYRRLYPLADREAARKRIDWLHFYGWGMIAITGAYLWILLEGYMPGRIVHRIVSIGFFMTVVCKALLEAKADARASASAAPGGTDALSASDRTPERARSRKTDPQP